MRRLDAVLGDVPLLADLPAEQLELMAGCASNVHIDAGAVLFREGDPADVFYVVREGTVALELHAPPRGSLTIETIGSASCSAGRGSSRPTAGTSTRAR